MTKFEPGSYQIPAGLLPSLACYKLDKNKKEAVDYVLKNAEVAELTEQAAIGNAEKSLNKAFE